MDALSKPLKVYFQSKNYLCAAGENFERCQISARAFWKGGSDTASDKTKSKRVANDIDKHNWIVAILCARPTQMQNPKCGWRSRPFVEFSIVSRLMSALVNFFVPKNEMGSIFVGNTANTDRFCFSCLKNQRQYRRSNEWEKKQCCMLDCKNVPTIHPTHYTCNVCNVGTQHSVSSLLTFIHNDVNRWGWMVYSLWKK